ncbi:hypothetical protein HID58_015557, partial [Brassica napus]
MKLNYLGSTGTPVVNVTKSTISATNALSKFPQQQDAFVQRQASKTQHEVSCVSKKKKFPIHSQTHFSAGIQPFNNNKTVAGKHAEEHTSMRHIIPRLHRVNYHISLSLKRYIKGLHHGICVCSSPKSRDSRITDLATRHGTASNNEQCGFEFVPSRQLLPKSQ